MRPREGTPDGEAPHLRLTEKQFMQAVIDRAQELGWMVFHPHDSRRSPAGFPDLVMVRVDARGNARLEAAELKVGDRGPTPAQRTWLGLLEAVRECARESGFGGVGVRLWSPEDWFSGRIEEVL